MKVSFGRWLSRQRERERGGGRERPAHCAFAIVLALIPACESSV